jgi:hypothetical protein
MMNKALPSRGPWVPVAAALLLASCVGGIGDLPEQEDPGAKTLAATDATVMRRLNRVELAHTFEDVLGDAYKGDPDAVDQRMSNDPLVQGFDTISEALTTTAGFVEQAHGLIEYMVGQTDIATLSACDAAALGEGACVDAFLDEVGLRVLRRPLDATERASYKKLFDKVHATEPHDTALAAVLTRMFQSPDFLYHVALGDPGTGKLVDHELAARLSYLLWESMPDEALFEAAATGKLRTAADVEREVARMLEDPRAKRTLTRFFELWLHIDALDVIAKDPTVYADFDALRPSMRTEFDMFLEHVVGGGGDLRALLTSQDTFVDAPLAGLYGVDPPAGAGFAQVKLDAKQRAGILTQSAFLSIFGKATRSAPILRGVFVRERLLCAPLPPPPANAAVIPPDLPSPTTTRAFFEDLTASDKCMACHQQINPIGFGFESYDGIGRYRTTEKGFPVDASGALTAGDQAGPFDGAVELAGKLADSEDVHRCLATQWLRFRFGRVFGPHDRRIVDQLDADLAKEGGKLRALALALARSEALYDPHFQLPAEEVTP